MKEKKRAAEGLLSRSRDSILGGTVSAGEIDDAQKAMQEGKAKVEELTQEQFNLEKKIVVDQEKAAAEAATKAAQHAIQLEERRDASLARQAAALRSGMQAELELYKAAAKEREDAETNSFDRGLLTIAQYFERRRASLTAEQKQEAAILAKEIADAQAEADRMGAEGRANQGKSKRAGGPDTEIGAEYAAAADKEFTTQEALNAKVAELKTKRQTMETGFRTQLEILDTEAFQRTAENNTKVLEFEKLIDATRHDGIAAAMHEIEIEKQKLAIVLEQSGASKAQIDARLAAYAQIKTAEATFDAEQKSGIEGLKVLADERAVIEDKVKSGKLFQAQADEQIEALEQARLPVLQQIAAELAAQAKATGDQQKIAQAADFGKQVAAISVQADQVGQDIAKIKGGMQSSLTGGIEQFFGMLMEGTRSVGQAFRGLAASVISSLASMMAQMVAQMIVAKLLKAAMSSPAAAPSRAERPADRSRPRAAV